MFQVPMMATHGRIQLYARHITLISLAALLFAGHAMAQTRDLPRAPTAAEFQKTIPENAEFRTSRTVKGHEAVLQLRRDAGLDVANIARFNVADPLLTDSTSLQATIQHSESTSRGKALAVPAPDWTTAQNNVGDTITQTWTEGGWSYSSTYTWNGTEWGLTAFSAHKDTRQEP